MRTLLTILVLLLVYGSGARAQETPPDALVVVAEGMAPLNSDPTAAEEEALWDAKRNAVEQAAGLFLKARTVGRDFTIEEDEIRAKTGGFVRSWERVPDSRRIETIDGARILRIKVRAVVALLPVVRKLADMADVYNDLERPRIKVEITGDDRSRRAANTLIAALKADGFEVASDGQAEVTLAGRLETIPILKFGDPSGPKGLGELIATCRARLTVRLLSAASEEVLLASEAEGIGRSFVGDADAASDAVSEAASVLLTQKDRQFTTRLLARWVQERQEGYVAALRVTGLTAAARERLKTELGEMRGFRKFVGERVTTQNCELRFLTRLDTRSLRRRLATLSLKVENERGPLILCSARGQTKTKPSIARR